jgi:nanoRNase/pAp phosphatase (c-di-AMP/oligoRNAs hydrolase)
LSKNEQFNLSLEKEANEKEQMDKIYDIFVYFLNKQNDDEQIRFDNIENNAVQLTKIFFQLNTNHETVK